MHKFVLYFHKKEEKQNVTDVVFKKLLGMIIDGTPVNCFQFRAVLMLCAQQMLRLQAWVAVY